MDITNFLAYIDTKMIIVAVALYGLGIIIKAIPKIPDWFIPMILGVVGIILGVIIGGGLAGALQGFLCACSAVFTNQVIKQSIKRDSGDNDSEDDKE